MGKCLWIIKGQGMQVYQLQWSLWFSQVDCSENSDLCKRLNVMGFPSFKLFKKGVEAEKFASIRTAGANGSKLCHLLNMGYYMLACIIKTIYKQYMFSWFQSRFIFFVMYQNTSSPSSHITSSLLMILLFYVV